MNKFDRIYEKIIEDKNKLEQLKKERE